MSREKHSASAKGPHSSADSPVPLAINAKKPFKINPIPKFDLSKFNFEIPEGEWCCPWIVSKTNCIETLLRPHLITKNADFQSHITKQK